MDYKVLTAVFLTLFAIAFATSGFESGLQGLSDLGEIGKKLGDFGGGLGGISGSGDSPNTTLQAEFTASGNHSDVAFSGHVNRLALRGEPVNVGLGGFSTETGKIVLTNYTGELEFNGNVSISGRAESVQLASTSLGSDSPGRIQVFSREPSSLNVTNISDVDLGFTDVAGSFSFGSQTITLEQGPAELQSFTGRLEKKFDGQQYSLHGKLFRAVLGSGDTKTTIGG